MASTYSHLTLEQRSQLSGYIASGLSQRAIARKMQVAPSTISRERRRNQSNGVYSPTGAHENFQKRRHKRQKIIIGALKNRVVSLLTQGWSPEQISGRLRKESMYVSHESIYAFVHEDRKNGGVLYKKLRRKGKKYAYKRINKGAGRGHIKNRVDIAERPRVVESKKRLGDWEIDLIIGARHKGCILTAVDRVSKKTLMRPVKAKRADLVEEAIIALFLGLPAHIPLHTITSDNGKEFAHHERIAERLNVLFFFSRPYRSSDRGLNEHTNGLIREYFPKKMPLDKISHEQCLAVQEALNERPRKVLQYFTPNEVSFFKSGVALQP